MQVHIFESTYNLSDDLMESNRHIQDVPELPFQAARNPLYVGVKDQQVSRMKERMNREKLGGTSIGFWDLITKKGKVNWDKFKDHDVVFLSGPERAHEKFRAGYTELIELIKSNLC